MTPACPAAAPRLPASHYGAVRTGVAARAAARAAALWGAALSSSSLPAPRLHARPPSLLLLGGSSPFASSEAISAVSAPIGIEKCTTAADGGGERRRRSRNYPWHTTVARAGVERGPPGSGKLTAAVKEVPPRRRCAEPAARFSPPARNDLRSGHIALLIYVSFEHQLVKSPSAAAAAADD